jgi:hypothetical protein
MSYDQFQPSRRRVDSRGYPPHGDGEVRSFMCRQLSEQNKNSIISSIQAESASRDCSSESSPSSSIKNAIFLESMAAAAWDHSIAVGLLQASFEICKLHLLLIATEARC